MTTNKVELMTMKHHLSWLLAVLFLTGCYKSSSPDEGDHDAGGSDTETHTSADADADTDTDADADTNSDTATETVECDGGWYDSTTDLCWQDPPSQTGWHSAHDYCEDGTWGGHIDWYLPNIDELISLVRGCQNGSETGDLSLSTCEMTPAGCVASYSCSDKTGCGLCAQSQGPGSDGCYWDPALSGACMWYWSSSSYAPDSDYAWFVAFYYGAVGKEYKGYATFVRCVRRSSKINSR
ncbi:MAG: DUF1566 domain-containing protein [Proteobacteria bacterium]|nr:DUF1566 domain-containing protein [Pseudomonadota bacterium]